MMRFDTATAAIASARRASAADRHAAMRFDVELRPLTELAAIADEWRRLSGRAVEPNAFYEPAFALAAAPLLGANVQVGLVWSQTPRQLVGFFPVRLDRGRYGVPFSMLVGWTHPYAPYGMPLVDRDMVEPVIAAWIDYIAHDPSMPQLVLMPLLHENGLLATALADALSRRGCQATAFDRHQRPLLAPGANRADYFQRTMGGKRFRHFRRRQRRVEELGGVRLEQLRDTVAVAHGLDDFFRIEAGGWKGRAGTAAAQNEDVRRFMHTAVAGLSAENKVVIERLCAGGKTIAAAVALKSGDCAWGWKVAYDEAFADYSPGILAVAGLTETLLAERGIAQADSCASVNDTMAPQLWTESLSMADWLFTAAPGEFSFAIASRLEALRRTAFAAAKSARDHLRRRR
jgi:CelD/BcsL family acetyltransferase involved in cellulose biosynthesis